MIGIQEGIEHELREKNCLAFCTVASKKLDLELTHLNLFSTGNLRRCQMVPSKNVQHPSSMLFLKGLATHQNKEQGIPTSTRCNDSQTKHFNKWSPCRSRTQSICRIQDWVGQLLWYVMHSQDDKMLRHFCCRTLTNIFVGCQFLLVDAEMNRTYSGFFECVPKQIIVSYGSLWLGTACHHGHSLCSVQCA